MARTFRGEFFEVLGPISTSQFVPAVSFFPPSYGLTLVSRYAEVFWRSQTVSLPPEIVARFDNSVMAITGLEIDIVRIVNGTAVSVPCTEQYNHHFS